MTIKVVVTNDDSRETAVIRVKQANTDLSEMPGAHIAELKGGESCEMFVHNGCSLIVKEVSV